MNSTWIYRLLFGTCTLLFVLPGCTQEQQEVPLQGETVIPEHLRELENITVIPADAEPSHEISFTPEISFSDTEEAWIALVSYVAVDDSGRVYIADTAVGYRAIHVFDPDGNYLVQLGGEGQGPGEFQSIRSMQIAGGHLYVYDNNLLRINVFSLHTLSFSHTVNLEMENWDHIPELDAKYPTHLFFRDDGNFLIGFTDKLRFDPEFLDQLREDKFIPTSFYLFDQEGRVREQAGKVFEVRGFVPQSVMTHRGGAAISSFPFHERSLMVLSENGLIYYAETEEFLIKTYNQNGGYMRGIYSPFQRAELAEEEVFDRFDHPQTSHYQYVRNEPLPDRWPALDAILLDDRNRVWASLIIDDPELDEWRVLDENGDLLARFEWPGERFYRTPAGKEIKAVKGDHIYVHETEEETGIHSVVRYRIEMKMMNNVN